MYYGRVGSNAPKLYVEWWAFWRNQLLAKSLRGQDSFDELDKSNGR